jgi:hypothetical protein
MVWQLQVNAVRLGVSHPEPEAKKSEGRKSTLRIGTAILR